MSLRTKCVAVLCMGVLIAVGFTMIASASGENKFSLVSQNGLSFGLIKGYENWVLVSAHHRTDKNEIKFILGNTKVIEAFKNGAGKNSKAFPDGSILVKIAYSIKNNPDFESSLEPDVLQRVEYMLKDGKKFPETGGWGYARFMYDAKTNIFSPYGKDASFAQECYACHTRVAKKDYVFTEYTPR